MGAGTDSTALSTGSRNALCFRTCLKVLCFCGGFCGASMRKASTTVDVADLEDIPDDLFWLVVTEVSEFDGPEDERVARLVWLLEDLGDVLSWRDM